MSDSYPFRIYSGLLEEKHYKRIGTALWFFLWCINSITKDVETDGVTWGIVLGNKPMKLSELSEPFGVNDKTVSRWLDTLEQHQYIRVIRAPYGLIIKVNNSKKYKVKLDKNVQSEPTEQTKMSDLSDGDKTIMSDLSDGDKTIMSDLPDNNVRSNKDLIKTLIDRLIEGLNNTKLISRCGVLTTVMDSYSSIEIHLDDQSVLNRSTEFETYYNSQKGRTFPTGSDWVAVQDIAKQPIPMEFILFGIDLAFARHDKTKPYPTATINHFSYCGKVIMSTWSQLLKDIESSVTPLVPSSEVSHGFNRKTKQQKEMDELDKIIAEGKRNGPSGGS